jgi:pyruvate-ferredoxin/flavodoxin oxidoreductase
MRHVCGGVIGYPITPSTEIAELYEAARAEGGVNVWGKHPFFFEPEGEHSAQSGALGASLTGGQFISNASSSQGILYAMESHYVTVGKKTGGFVLQVAARVVSKHSLNVMAGHDDVYALLSAGYTILFGSNPQEAADLAAIAYRTSALSLIPVANAMDGFSTSHMLSEALLPEPDLLREYLGDPAGRIASPTVAQDLLFGAKGRVFQLQHYLERHRDDFAPRDLEALTSHLEARAEEIERDSDGDGPLIGETLAWVPEELRGQWRRQWVNALEKGTRQMVPALVDVNNPGLTGPVQNQPDFQAGAVDHRTHFVNAVPDLTRRAMAEYSELTGRVYTPLLTYDCDDADYIMIGLGSITDDVRAVLPYLRAQGLKVGVVSVKLLQPFPEADVIEALAGAKAVTVLERSDQTALTAFVTQALFKARANADGAHYDGLPTLHEIPRLTTAIFGLGGHDVQPRHIIAAYKHMEDGESAPLIYLGSQFFTKDPDGHMAEIQARLHQAYPETELMALETEANPVLLPPSAMRIRFHSVGGYGTIATGKLLTDILAGVLGMHSKSAPKYGSEKSGAPTNYYITLSPEPVLLTNAELEDVEIVVSPDHKSFIHANPLKGLVEGGTFILQSDLAPEDVWRELPKYARKTIRDKHIHFIVLDAFSVAKKHAPSPELELRMMGIAFIGAVVGHVDRVTQGASAEAITAKVQAQIAKKFGGKGDAVVEGNMAVIRDGMSAARIVEYDAPAFLAIEEETGPARTLLSVALSADMCTSPSASAASGLFDPAYYEDLVARPFREGTMAEAPVLPGIGLFMPAGTSAGKDKGLFRRSVPEFHFDTCTGCMECALVCPDAAIPNSVHEIHDLLLTGIKEMNLASAQQEALRSQVYALAERVREAYRKDKTPRPFHEFVAAAARTLDADNPTLVRNLDALVSTLAIYPVARTRPFFDAMESDVPGTGGLFAATIDPWKCTGCLECIEVCGPGALTPLDQDEAILEEVQDRFEFMTQMPNTPKRFYEGSTGLEGDLKRLLLDHPNFYATAGGHGGCRGCGEVTAIRLVMATSHALGDGRRRAHLRELDALVARLQDKADGLDPTDTERHERLTSLIATLETRLYLYEGGPTGNGPASTVIANATGCRSGYASTRPCNS